MSQCISCGTSFSCAMADPHDATPCWCTQLQPLSGAAITVLAQVTGARCLCPTCLAAAVAEAKPASPGP